MCEQRAKAYCEYLIQYNGAEFGVEWKKSAMYGYNPVILHHGDKCTNISGCGYDKLSAALASVLCFLFPLDSEAHNAIAALSGCGLSSVQGRLSEMGWTLDRTACGSAFDGFRLSRKEAA